MFRLKWRNELTGYECIVSYDYIKSIAKMSSIGYKLHCISVGKRDGFKYLGQVR